MEGEEREDKRGMEAVARMALLETALEMLDRLKSSGLRRSEWDTVTGVILELEHMRASWRSE